MSFSSAVVQRMNDLVVFLIVFSPKVFGMAIVSGPPRRQTNVSTKPLWLSAFALEVRDVTPGWYGDLGRCNSVHVVLDVRPKPETEGEDGDGAAAG